MSGGLAAKRTPRKRTAITIGASALAVIAVSVGLVIWQPFSDKFVPQYEVAEVQPALATPGDPAPASTGFTEIRDVSEELKAGFASDISDARTLVTDDAERLRLSDISAEECLLAWAKENLAVLSRDGTYEVVTACGRPTAVLAGPAAADSKMLVYTAFEDYAPEGMLEVLGGSTSDQMAFVAVQSADGKAQLLAAAELPPKG